MPVDKVSHQIPLLKLVEVDLNSLQVLDELNLTPQLFSFLFSLVFGNLPR